MKSDKVVLFPGLKKQLEEKSLAALQDRRYEEALEYLDTLLRHDAGSHEVVVGKLMCLMELGRHEEAQTYAEEYLDRDHPFYYHYLHIYLTILFQTNQYGLLMEMVAEEKEVKGFPPELEEQFSQLYEMSEKMKMDIDHDRSTEKMEALFTAVQEDDHRKQWYLLEQLRMTNFQPNEAVEHLLGNPHVHPVVKTSVLLWLRQCKIDHAVEIHKFETSIEIAPKHMESITEQHAYRSIHTLLEAKIEQNPSLLNLAQQLHYRYFYVIYPFLPNGKETEAVANAVIGLAKQYLQMKYLCDGMTGEVKKYMDEIKMCDSLYLSIIDG